MTDRHAFEMLPRPKVKRFEPLSLGGDDKLIPIDRTPAAVVVNPFAVIERLARDTSINKDDRLDMILQIAREAMKGEKP